MLFLPPPTPLNIGGSKIITKLINRLIIITILCSTNLIAYGEITYLKGESYDKDGCIYLIGNLTKEERAEQNRIYK